MALKNDAIVFVVFNLSFFSVISLKLLGIIDDSSVNDDDFNDADNKLVASIDFSRAAMETFVCGRRSCCLQTHFKVFIISF